MRLACLAAAALLCACASGPDRVETLSRAPSFHAKVLAIAGTRGAGPWSAKLAGALARRLEASGIRAADLQKSDSVLAGAALSLDIAADPRALAEVRRATGSDGIVFLTLDPDRRALGVLVLDAGTGDVVLRATARPGGMAFGSPEAAASAAAAALLELAPERREADELALPDVRDGN